MSDPTLIQHDGLLLTTMSEFAGDDWRSVADRIKVDPKIIAGLKEDGDDDPFFVTMPVARIGAKSRGGSQLVYGKIANQQIVEQINQRKQEGGLGHLKDDETETKYDLPPVMAVGALTDEQGTTWSKFYVPKYAQDMRDYYRTKMRLNANAAFSLWGQAWAHPTTHEVVRLDLKRIDVADPERAGLDVAAVPIVSREQAGNVGHPPEPETDEITQEGIMPQEIEVQLREMRETNDALQANITTLQTRMAEMAGVLGVDQGQIIATVRDLNARAQVMSEMARVLDVEPNAIMDTVRQLQTQAGIAVRVSEMLHNGEGEPDVNMIAARVTEMQTTLDTYRKVERKQAVLGLIDGSRDDVKEPLVKLPDLIPVVVAHMGVEDTWPKTDDAVRELVNGILDRPEIKKLSEMIVKATGGGAMKLGAEDNGGHGDQKTDAEIDAEAAKLAADLGVNSPR